jgi:hypothetical protein
MTSHHDLQEIINRTSKTFEVLSQTEDGEWVSRLFANEAAAREYEKKMAKQDVPTKRS